MSKIFTEEQTLWIKQQLETHAPYEVLEMIKENFNINITAIHFKQWRGNHKIKSAVRKNPYKNQTFLFSDEIINFIKLHIDEYEAPVMAAKINELYGTSYTAKQIKNWKGNHHTTSQVLTGSFNAERPNPHKGQKGWSIKNSEKTRFTKGNESYNKVAVDTEVKDSTTGYWKVKIAQPNIWKFKHILLYENAYGPIPKGMNVIFLDNNKDNLTIENLALVTKAEAAQVRNYKTAGNTDLTKAAIGIAKITTKLKESKNEQ